MVCLVVPLLLAAGPAWGANSDAGAQVGPRAADEAVACPAELDGVPLSLDEEFAGTPRALANDDGVLVRYTLLCPYHRASGQSVAELTLSWSRYDADDLNCETLELVSEPAGDGRVQGLVDHPSLSARVTFGAASQEVLPAVEDAASELLARVPGDTAPCVGGSGGDVDATLAPTESPSPSGLPIALVMGVLGGTVVVVAALLSRNGRRRARAASASASEPGGDEPGMGTGAAGETGIADDRDPVPRCAPSPEAADAGSGVDERSQAVERLRIDEARLVRLEQALAAAGADLALHRAHAEAVRRLAASVATDRAHAEYLSSFAGCMALAGAATNLVSTSARRAASLVDDDRVAEQAGRLERLHQEVIAAAEAGLDDSRFWLWQDRRLAVVEALSALEGTAPRLVAAQRRLTAHVADLGRAHETTRNDLARTRATLGEIDSCPTPPARRADDLHEDGVP